MNHIDIELCHQLLEQALPGRNYIASGFGYKPFTKRFVLRVAPTELMNHIDIELCHQLLEQALHKFKPCNTNDFCIIQYKI